MSGAVMLRGPLEWMSVRTLTALGCGLLGVLAACGEEIPTSLDSNRFPPSPITLDLTFDWNEFGSSLETYGGYGTPAELVSAVLASDFQGGLDAHTLVRFAAYPVTVSVRDTSGATRPDSSLTYLGGRLVAFFDTLSSRTPGPVQVALEATTTEWHAQTATWAMAVDSLGDTRSWSEPGGGPVEFLGTATWDPGQGDSVAFEIDSARIAAWADTTDATRGARLSLLTPGARVDVVGTGLRLLTLPSTRPDSTFYLNVLQRELTFLYDPYPTAPTDGGMRIGGVPAWRAVLELAPPAALIGPPELCAVAGCPVQLSADQVNYAAIVITPKEVAPAFRPSDTVTVDARAVLSPTTLPKSPLGQSLSGFLGQRLPPDVFGEGQGGDSGIEVPITSFVRDIVRGEDLRGDPAPRTIALLSRIEPFSLPFASFHGPGSAFPPRLKLVVTVTSPLGAS